MVKFNVNNIYDSEKEASDSKPVRRQGESMAEYLYRCRQANLPAPKREGSYMY